MSGKDKKLSQVDLEALELAANKCVGRYGMEHLWAWDRLKALGLVKNVRTSHGAWFEPTGKGRQVLAASHETGGGVTRPPATT